eukprot:7009021-Pyramimonas_sp.AAC.1
MLCSWRFQKFPSECSGRGTRSSPAWPHARSRLHNTGVSKRADGVGGDVPEASSMSIDNAR